MAYTTGTLSALAYEIGGRARVWIYVTGDSLATALASNYISDAGKKRIQLGDEVHVFAGTLNTNISASPSTVAAGTASEFAAGSSPSFQLCTVSAVSGTGQTMTATLQPVGSGTTGLTFPRNLIDGGDFLTNPWQRGTSFTSIAATATYTADRFFVVGNDASVSAKAARAAFSSTAGFSQSFRFGRTANASSLSAIIAGQVLETSDCIGLQGQSVTLSFWAASEANYSPASALLGVTLLQGTGTDQSAASALAGTWTAQTNVVSATQALTSTMTRYSFTGTVSSNTTQLAMLLTQTPVGSAGAADSCLIMGVQLEAGAAPSTFERHDVEMELARCQRYAFVINEPASGVAVTNAASTASNKFAMTIALPTPMRVAPTLTVVNGSFGFQLAAAYLAGSSLASATVVQTQYAINVTQLATVASNNAAVFVGGGGVGSIIASAEY